MRTWMALVAATLLVGCKPSPSVECTSDVTAGRGTFHGRATGKVADDALRRAAEGDACTKMCAATAKQEERPACAARCAVDIGAAKIGARTSCGNVH